MNPRIHGIETEYGTLLKKPDGSWEAGLRDGDLIRAPVTERLIRYLGHSGIGTVTGAKNEFAENGSRIYIDSGHIEYATPECLTAQDAVAADIAGSELLADWFSEPFGAGRLVFIKETVGPGSSGALVSFGCHENFSLPYPTDEKAMKSDDVYSQLRLLLPFFITRQLIAGAGTFAFDRFQLSARSNFLGYIVNAQTIDGSRSIINTRPEHLGSLWRLHLILGDANMSEVSSLLKIGTTAIVLSLLEDGHIFEDFQLNIIDDAVSLLKRIADDPTGRGVLIKLRNLKEATAIDIQRRYYTLARQKYGSADIPNNLRKSLRQIFYWWDYVLSRLEAGDTDDLTGVLDWATKRHLGMRWLEQRGIPIGGLYEKIRAEPDKANAIRDGLRAIEQRYHEISDDGYYYQLKKAGVMRTILSRRKIERLKRNPPGNTRAYSRGALIRWINVHRARVAPKIVDWHAVSLDVHGLSEIGPCVFDLQDPFVPLPLPVRDFFRTIAPKLSQRKDRVK